MKRARRSRERVLGHLTELSGLPLGGGPDPTFRERLRAELATADRTGDRAADHTAHRTAHRTADRAADRTAQPAAGSSPRHARPAHRRPRRRRRLASQLASSGVAAVMLLSTIATYRAVPGDPLYPLKRATESTLVRLSTDDVVRAERELVSAETRAREVAQLLGETGEGALVGRTLREMEQSTRAGVTRLERAEPRSPKIGEFAETQRNRVEPMIEKLDGDEHDQAVGYLHYIEGLVPPSR
ncbi:DUF5667 domain-containing protein [Nonomuraea sp. CA-218870]|uniref:DUF5667 domain-containing protein n=1 Tax=Nonomuraea sp. CA-218870 TaxID=3239998 RepID=UPI003D8E6F26